MNPLPRWCCENCGTLHPYPEDAAACCRPEVTLMYVCGACKKVYEIEQAAEACCTDGEFEAPPDPAELEKAGQGRLL